MQEEITLFLYMVNPSSTSARYSDSLNLNPVRSSKNEQGNSNIILPKDSFLLHLGIDWLAMFINDTDGGGRVEQLFKHIFSGYGYYLNHSERKQFIWPSTLETFECNFSEGKGDLFANVYFKNKKILSIRKITFSSNYMHGLTSRFTHLVSFYGTFFALDKQGDLSFYDTYKLFLDDGVTCQLSRVDICFDINNKTTLDVWKTCKATSKQHLKEYDFRKIDPITKIPGTIEYGESKNPWYLTIYNKKKEFADNNKFSLYKDYWHEDIVTRTEVKLKRSKLKPYGVNYRNILDVNVQLGILDKLLNHRFVKWGIWPKVQKELKKKGYLVRDLKTVPSPPGDPSMPRDMVDKIMRDVLRLSENSDVRHGVILDRIKTEADKEYELRLLLKS